MRLDRFLSESSTFSRKEIRLLIRKGCVCVNGRCAGSPDQKTEETDLVTVNGQTVPYRKYVYLMMNKPAGYLSATEDDHDPVVVSLLPEEFRHYAPFPVGRLDKDTEGLLLLTNDGAFDHAVCSPRREVRKRYFARLSGPASEEHVSVFASGMAFREFTAKPALLEITEDPSQVFVEISEGKFHQVKRMCERIGREVLYLKRVAVGALKLDESLPPGGVRELTDEEKSLFR